VHGENIECIRMCSCSCNRFRALYGEHEIPATDEGIKNLSRFDSRSFYWSPLAAESRKQTIEMWCVACFVCARAGATRKSLQQKRLAEEEASEESPPWTHSISMEHVYTSLTIAPSSHL